MVVPNRIVQAQGLVASAPLIAGSLVAVDHDGRYSELTHPGAERDAALAAADDHDVRLCGVTEFAVFDLLLLGPRDAVRVCPMLGAARTTSALTFFVPLQLLQRRQQGPTFISLQTKVSVRATGCSLELDPG